MKKSLIILILLTIISGASYAQSAGKKPDSVRRIRIDGPTKLGPSPLYLLLYQGKQYSMDTTAMKKGVLNPEYIKSINVYKDQETLSRYGAEAKNGVILITIDEKQNKAFESVEKYLTVF